MYLDSYMVKYGLPPVRRALQAKLGVTKVNIKNKSMKLITHLMDRGMKGAQRARSEVKRVCMMYVCICVYVFI